MVSSRIVPMVLGALLFLVMSSPATGAAGECNGDGSVDMSDAIFVIQYLGGGPPPVSFSDCDCDEFPGVNIGDAFQIIENLTVGGTLYAWPGPDLIVPANTGVMVSGTADGVGKTKVFIFINNPAVLTGGMTLPFTFAAAPGEADLDCTGITFGPLFSGFGSSYDNVNKSILLVRSYGVVPTTANWVVLCEITFAPDLTGSPGTAHAPKPATIGRYFPLFVAKPAYTGTNYERILFPRFIPDAFGTIGDANCDGAIDISDAVYLIAFIFSGGPKPGDPDDDGIPNCPGL